MKNVYGSVVLLMVFFVLTVLNVIVYRKGEENRDYVMGVADSFVKERGHSWLTAEGAPDSIYFVSFADDTTWYVKADRLEHPTVEDMKKSVIAIYWYLPEHKKEHPTVEDMKKSVRHFFSKDVADSILILRNQLQKDYRDEVNKLLDMRTQQLFMTFDSLEKP